MILRKAISFIAKKIYSSDYQNLRRKILATYSKVEINSIRKETKLLEQLLISGEDHRFKYHLGFDPIAILRAIRNTLIYSKNEGASTINQQLVRVLTIDYRKSLSRKVKEIFLATTLYELIPQDEIPVFYLQVAYYGPNMVGLSTVVRKLNIAHYCDISETLAAEIVARLKYPESINRSSDRIIQIEKRKNHLLFLHKKHKSYKLFNPY